MSEISVCSDKLCCRATVGALIVAKMVFCKKPDLSFAPVLMRSTMTLADDKKPKIDFTMIFHPRKTSESIKSRIFFLDARFCSRGLGTDVGRTNQSIG